MSLINQMLQDLEKRRPQGATTAVLPVQVVVVAQRRSLHFARGVPPLIAALLVAGLSIWLLPLRPFASDRASVTSLARTIPAASVTPQPASAQPAPVNAVQDIQTPPSPVQVGIPFPDNSAPAMDMGTALPQASPAQNGAITIALSQATLQPAPVTALPPQSPVTASQSLPLPGAAAGQKQPRVAPTPDPHTDDHLTHNRHTETTQTTGFTKHLKEITSAQQAENEYHKALESMRQGRMTRALESLAQALQADPGHVAARQTMVGLLVEARRFDEAERRLQEGLALGPGQPPGFAMMLARLQVERGDTRVGLETLQRHLPDAMASANPVMEQADYQAFLAALLQREGRHGEAIENYLQALRNAPQSGLWLMGIGISLQAEKRFQEAQEAFRQAKLSNALSPDLQAFVEQRLRQIKQQS